MAVSLKNCAKVLIFLTMPIANLAADINQHISIENH
jgi:hypothetical protein